MKGNIFRFKVVILPRCNAICYTYIVAIYFIFILGDVEKCYCCNDEACRGSGHQSPIMSGQNCDKEGTFTRLALQCHMLA